jgi:hypothetical protein
MYEISLGRGICSTRKVETEWGVHGQKGCETVLEHPSCAATFDYSVKVIFAEPD